MTMYGEYGHKRGENPNKPYVAKDDKDPGRIDPPAADWQPSPEDPLTDMELLKIQMSEVLNVLILIAEKLGVDVQ